MNFLDWAESHIGILSQSEKPPEIRPGPKVRDENSLGRNSGLLFFQSVLNQFVLLQHITIIDFLFSAKKRPFSVTIACLRK